MRYILRKFLFGVSIFALASGAQAKQDVCHKGETINIALSAVQAHIDHGDVIGECKDVSINKYRLFGGPFVLDSPSSSGLNCSIVSQEKDVWTKIKICTAYTHSTDDPNDQADVSCETYFRGTLQWGDVQSVDISLDGAVIPEIDTQTIFCKVVFNASNRSAIRGTTCLTGDNVNPGVCVNLQ